MAACSISEGEQRGVSADRGQASLGDAAQDSIATTNERPEWWPEDGLAAQIPFPYSQSGEVLNDLDDCFQAYVNDSSEADYNAYVDACKNAGFVVDAKENASGYEAYSEDGYWLRVYPHNSEQYFVVNLDAPRELGVLSWPSKGPGSLLPAPNSQAGKVDIDSSSAFGVYVGDMDREMYDAYIEACSDAGFSVDNHNYENMYTAQDASGDSVKVEYLGYDTAYVYVSLSEG